jgi:UDP-glucose 4-epimerase
MPYICRVARGTLVSLPIYGDDYPTPDGTCIRDYIHVVDLAKGHIKAIEYLEKSESVATPINLGTGRGYSVKEIVAGFENAAGFAINKHIAPRRAGDIPKMEASVTLAKELLGWQAELGLGEMCGSSWNYARK